MGNPLFQMERLPRARSMSKAQAETEAETSNGEEAPPAWPQVLRMRYLVLFLKAQSRRQAFLYLRNNLKNSSEYGETIRPIFRHALHLKMVACVLRDSL